MTAMSHDPLADPEPLIRRVYSYVAYRIGDGPDAEDVTSTTIERALRYRSSFDPRKGRPQSWLIGIARSCVDDFLRGRPLPAGDVGEPAASDELESEALLRLSVGELLAMKSGAVDVALHRARERLRSELAGLGVGGVSSAAMTVRGAAAEPS